MKRKQFSGNLGWCFSADRLRDGRPIPPPGETLYYGGFLRLGQTGYHFARSPYVALKFAHGTNLHLVRYSPDDVIMRGGVGTARKLTIVASMDATPLLNYYSRTQALRVIQPWDESGDLPDVVLDFLMTGDEGLRSVVYAAAAQTWLTLNNECPLRSTPAMQAASAVAAAASADYSVLPHRSHSEYDFMLLVYAAFKGYL